MSKTNSIAELIERVCKRPQVFTPSGTFFEVIAYLSGYSAACTNDFAEDFSEFGSWISHKFRKGPSYDWVSHMQNAFPDDKVAIEQLRLLYTKYRKAQMRKRSVSMSDQGLEYDEYINALRNQALPDAAQTLEALFPVTPETSVLDLLAIATTLKGWLDGFRPLPPDVVAELKHVTDVRYTYHSNAIEGNTLTQSETAMVLEKGITVGGKSLTEHLEVVGHKEAIDYIEALAAQKIPLREREIRDLHNLILRGIDRQEAGRYRTLDVQAAGTGHVYPPHFRLPELMTGFVGWLESEAAQNLHPLVYAAEAHYRFVAIHPFKDCNGRTGRLLMNLLLLQRGYPVAVVTNERRTEYIDALIHAQEHNDDTERLTRLIAEASQASLIETLRVLSTAAASRGKGLPFYRAMPDSQGSGTMK